MQFSECLTTKDAKGTKKITSDTDAQSVSFADLSDAPFDGLIIDYWVERPVILHRTWRQPSPAGPCGAADAGIQAR